MRQIWQQTHPYTLERADTPRGIFVQKKEKTLSFRKSLLFFTETTERPKISAILLSYEFVAAVVSAAATTLRNAVGTSISSGFYSSPN